ncbi:hypothetical protein BKA66DRAFT_573670 [Pyrenochaeta sp. MPI-SDFR-AT-0127]|nr:hypothetical protein BKA66DRAFT_573670 [Pyrenochaeta sp. MPI-SDFR-AT-0127]
MPSADTVENYQLVSIKSYSHPGEVQDHDLDSNDATSSHQQEASDVECLGTSEDNTTKRAIHRLSSSSRSSVEIAKQPNFFKFCVRPISDFCSSIDRRLTNRLRRSRYHGWRVGVLSALCMSTFVLCCNITLIVAGSVVNGGYDKDGVANLVYGNERTISRWNTTFHVLINALSTILLAGSNYTMQVLSSPTRLDIDKAHAKGNWLEIGLLSPRNLRIISRKRMALCLLLAVSSVPLHLFYNASVFKIVIANDYAIFAVDRQSDGYARLASSPDTYLNLTNAQWKNTYNEEYVSGHGDLYLAIDQLAFSTSPTTVSLNMSDYLPWTTRSTFQRMISPSSDWISFALGNVTVTTVKTPGQSLPQDSASERVIDQLPVSMHVAHAFSRKTGPRSCIQISLYFMIVVVTFNSFKLIIMAYILVTDRSKYIVTLGDAAASFLEHPDSTTHGKCMLAMDKKLFSRGRPSCLSNLSNQNTRDISIYSTDVWRPRPQRYFSSVSFDKGSTSILS